MKIHYLLLYLLLLSFNSNAQPTLIPYHKGDKWGYCDKDKKIVLPCVYDAAAPFYEGLARVNMEGYYKFIDEKGTIVIDGKYEWAHHVYDGLIYAEISSEEWGNTAGFIDKKGKEIIPFRIEMPPVPLPIQERYVFSEGLIGLPWLEIPFEQAAYRFFDKTGAMIIQTNLPYARPFSGGLATVSTEPYEKMGIINKKGETFLKEDYYDIGPFSEGLARVRKEDLMGFIDEKGKLVISIQYSTFSNFSEGLVLVSKEDKTGFLNKRGKVTIPFIYDAAFSFSEGLAMVAKEGKTGFINKTGKTIIPFIFDFDVDFYQRADNTGPTGFRKGVCPVWQNGKMGFINNKGVLVIECKYDDFADMFDVQCFEQGLAYVRQGEIYFYIDLKGNEYYEE